MLIDSASTRPKYNLSKITFKKRFTNETYFSYYICIFMYAHKNALKLNVFTQKTYKFVDMV